jgi:toxin HigB-1
VIRSFRSADTQALFEVGKCKKFSGIANIAIRKLAQLDAAQTLEFLRSPPGNRLEALKGERKGQHSIRVNDQFRVCFRWTDDGPEDVEIADYH